MVDRCYGAALICFPEKRGHPEGDAGGDIGERRVTVTGFKRKHKRLSFIRPVLMLSHTLPENGGEDGGC